jgi:GAF domain-containing protein
VPITARERVLGLINIAVMDGHKPVPEEEAFLSAIADSLAGLIERHQAETAKKPA